MLIAQYAQVIFVYRLFLFWLLFVTTIESKQYFIDHNQIQDVSRLLCKIQGFKGLEFGPIKFKVFQDFQGPVRTLTILHQDLWHTSSSKCKNTLGDNNNGFFCANILNPNSSSMARQNQWIKQYCCRKQCMSCQRLDDSARKLRRIDM